MLNKLIEKIVLSLESRCLKNGKVLKIKGTAKDDNDVYLIRYPLLSTALFSVYIHRFLRSDKDDPHDHPFSFVSYVVSGGYTESLFDKANKTAASTDTVYFHTITSRRKPGSLAFRKATDVHRVLVDSVLQPREYKKAPLTVILLGPRTRDWGFWVRKNKTFNNPGSRLRSFVGWAKYLNVDPNSPEAKKHL